MKVDVLYFAWLRERIGLSREVVETEAPDVAALVSELTERSPHHAQAFSDMAAVRVAVDQELASPETPLTDAREIAFFPPMTGG